MKPTSEPDYTISDDSESSDSSIDIEVIHPRLPNVSNHKYGIGATLMSKMGYQPGKGLGAQQQGIVEPIEQMLRIKKIGLGAVSAEKNPNFRGNQTILTQDIDSFELSQKTIKEERLKQLTDVLNSSESTTSVEFAAKFAQLPFWSELKLWEAVVAKLHKEYEAVSFKQFGEDVEKLTFLSSIIPLGFWDSFVLEFYWPKVPQNPDNVESVSDQLEILDELIIRPETYQLFMNFFLHHAQVILASPRLYERTTRLLPGYSSAVRESEGISLEELHSVQSPFDQARSYCGRLVGSDETCLLLEKYRSVLTHSEQHEIESEFIAPKWLKEIANRSFNKTLTKDWWQKFRTYITDHEVSLTGLNLINHLRDVGFIPMNLDASVNTPRATLSEALAQYCFAHNYNCNFESETSGTVVSSKGSVIWEIDDNSLFLTKNKLPRSFSEIDKYVK